MNRLSRAGRTPMVAALAALAVGCAPAQPAAAPAAIPELAGRTAGTPQSCIPIDQSTSLRIVNKNTVLYGSGGTIWVNHLRTECPGADRAQFLVAEPTGSQYCSGDQVQSLDPLTRIPGPVCVLGDFVPYRR